MIFLDGRDFSKPDWRIFNSLWLDQFSHEFQGLENKTRNSIRIANAKINSSKKIKVIFVLEPCWVAQLLTYWKNYA